VSAGAAWWIRCTMIGCVALLALYRWVIMTGCPARRDVGDPALRASAAPGPVQRLAKKSR
jgi:hypothetical protein